MHADDTILIQDAKRLLKAEDADLTGSSFTDVNLSRSTFQNVHFVGAQFEDANLSGWSILNANLAGLKIKNADMRGASIAGSLTAGMTIDGIPVADLMAAYRALTAKPLDLAMLPTLPAQTLRRSAVPSSADPTHPA